MLDYLAFDSWRKMEHADDDLDLHQPIEWQPEVEAFPNFVMLVVSKLGQETAEWNYDVRPEEKRLTIYMLSYKHDMVVVDTCLSLHFRSEPPDVPVSCAYSLTPTFSTKGQQQTCWLLFGRNFLISVAEVPRLLRRLDQDRLERDAAPCPSAKKAEKDGVAHEAFSEFTKQVVPQSGQETSAWKYDVQQTERRITVLGWLIRTTWLRLLTVCRCTSSPVRQFYMCTFFFLLLARRVSELTRRSFETHWAKTL
ncbi:hypothetical protein RvY_02733 [Ramazzottius varieornatus]|uniref:Uncharacterized protein n=1 Tax=Ramazzottius varieornatus TaxID=947166 RepID=A0A1D1UKQ9_RAMVA|nr:hypothetical protein RvY_02733 [Ramazzottius varieornatus]